MFPWIKTSINTNSTQRFSKAEGKPLSDIKMHKSMIGKLLYLTNICRDISFVVQQLSKFLQAPTSVHLTAAHRILRYLKGTPG